MRRENGSHVERLEFMAYSCVSLESHGGWEITSARDKKNQLSNLKPHATNDQRKIFCFLFSVFCFLAKLIRE